MTSWDEKRGGGCREREENKKEKGERSQDGRGSSRSCVSV